MRRRCVFCWVSRSWGMISIRSRIPATRPAPLPCRYQVYIYLNFTYILKLIANVVFNFNLCYIITFTYKFHQLRILSLLLFVITCCVPRAKKKVEIIYSRASSYKSFCRNKLKKGLNIFTILY